MDLVSTLSNTRLQLRTESDNNRENDGHPEGDRSEQDDNLIHEVDAREQRVYRDPSQHDHGRTDDDDPRDDSPTEKFQSATATAKSEERRRYALMGVHADVCVRTNDGSDGHSSTEVRQRLDRLPVPRDGRIQRPDKVRNEKDDGGLVKTVQHVHPELEARVL